MRSHLLLYAVTDSRWAGEDGLAAQVEAAIEGGVTMVQFREKNGDPEIKKATVIRLRDICIQKNIPLIIDDDVDLAKETGADGVHLGQSDMDPGEARKILGDSAIIGVTAKTVEQARLAQEAGADYLGSGAVFGTSTKLDTRPMSMETLRSITDAVNIPVVAIGGIDETNIDGLKGTGIAGVAVVSGIFSKTDVKAAAMELKAHCMRL
ncbi:MAG: thiamine phosphate synthase [Lachnospiraceae bacterium]|nr:thiamine phosphate synthase [Lachnospiraceae bacterium]